MNGGSPELVEQSLKVLVLNGFRDNWVLNRTQWYLIHIHNLTHWIGIGYIVISRNYRMSSTCLGFGF